MFLLKVYDDMDGIDKRSQRVMYKWFFIGNKVYRRFIMRYELENILNEGGF